MDIKEDQQLIQQIARGDSKAFGLLLEKYQDLVYGLSLKMVKEKSIAEDMTQETWMKVIKNAEKYSPVGSVKSWILQIHRNLVMDYFRQSKKWKNNEDIEDIEISDDAENAFESIQSQEQKSAFDQVFSALEERDKIVLTLVIVEELSYAEISKELGLSVGSIKTIVFRAKKELQTQLQSIRGGV